jgi:hypothetical protein
MTMTTSDEDDCGEDHASGVLNSHKPAGNMFFPACCSADSTWSFRYSLEIRPLLLPPKYDCSHYHMQWGSWFCAPIGSMDCET